jgi:hypothetical protein
MPRVINVTAGEKEYVTAVLTGDDLTGATFSVGLSTSTVTPPGSWTAADLVNSTPTETRVSMLVQGAPMANAARQFLWVRVTDIPEILYLVDPKGVLQVV